MTSPEMSDAAFKNLVVKSLGSLESQMRTINQRFMDLEEKTGRQDKDINSLKETANIQAGKIADLTDKLDEVAKAGPSTAVEPPNNNIVIKNLIQEDWGHEKTKTEVNKVIKMIDEKAPQVSKIKKLGTSKAALVTLGKGHKTAHVMRKKATLKRKAPYSRVFIELQKSIQEQRQEAREQGRDKIDK